MDRSSVSKDALLKDERGHADSPGGRGRSASFEELDRRPPVYGRTDPEVRDMGNELLLGLSGAFAAQHVAHLTSERDDLVAAEPHPDPDDPRRPYGWERAHPLELEVKRGDGGADTPQSIDDSGDAVGGDLSEEP
jgi:hypothetical protein